MSEKTIEEIKQVALLFLIAAVTVPLYAFVFMKLWEWILIPITHCGHITFGGSIAMMFVVGFIRRKKSKELTNKQHLERLGETILHCLFYLFAGWIMSGVIA